MFEDDSIDRRSFLKRAGAVTIGSVAVAGCGGGGDGSGNGGDSTPTPTSGNGGDSGGKKSFGGWMSNANNYTGVVDRTGKDTVTVKVGAGSTGLAFAPAAVKVSKGTKVKWKWTGKGGTHNVHAVKGASFESDLYSKEGVHFTHTFSQTDTVKYQCNPHAALGMKGVVVVK